MLLPPTLLPTPPDSRVLRASGLPDIPPEEEFDRLTSLVCRVLRVPAAFVFIVTEDGPIFKSCRGLPELLSAWRQTPLVHAFCQRVTASGEPLVISDARSHPLFCDNPALRGLGVEAYLGIPLLSPDGQAAGSFCAIDAQPRAWSEDDVTTLKDLAALATMEIAWRSHAEERKRAEDALRESERRLDLALQGAQLGVWEWNVQTGAFIINERWAEMLGYSLGELEPHIWMWECRVHPDDLAPVWQALADHFERGTSLYRTEHRLRSKAGEWRWVLDTGRVFEWTLEGAPLWAAGVQLDITEQKRAEAALLESEERLRLALRGAQAGVWEITLDTGAAYWSEEYRALYGFSPDEPTANDKVMARIHPDDLPLLKENHALLGRGPAAMQQEFRIIHPERGTRWVLDLLRVRRDADGQLACIGGVSLDVTERRQAEEAIRELNATLECRVQDRTTKLSRAVSQLEHTNHELETRNRELQDFAYVASHDLQEPLRKITTFSDLLLAESAEALGEQGRFYVERAQSSATRMSQLINDLLAFSRVQAKGVAFQHLDLAEVAGQVLTDLEMAISEAGACVEVGELCTVEADPVQMRQLLQNLVGNALKFRKPEAAPRIRIRSAIEEDLAGAGTAARPVCVLEVEDDGIGFDEKYLDRIFSPFQRLHGKEAYPGTGMGLAICRRIVERHGGGISARSTPGTGSTFVVRLPLRHLPVEQSLPLG